MSAPSAHALFSPSAAHRWIHCPGSIAMCEGAPDTSSKSADEGTAAHEVAAMALTEGRNASAYLGRLIDVNGAGWKVTQDMADAVQTYLDALRQYAEGHELLVEQRLDLAPVIGLSQQFGTSDAVVLTACGTEIQVHDYKHGANPRNRVDAEGNEQLMLYALGALEAYDLAGTVERVRMVIHQPRVGSLSEWDRSVDELRQFQATVRAAAVMASATPPVLTPGDKQCKWCKAKATCRARGEFVARTILNDFDVIDPIKKIEEATPASPLTMTADEIARLLPHLGAIRDWCDALEGHARGEALHGRLPGYKCVTGRKGGRTWRDELEAEQVLRGMRLKQDEMYTFKLISPTQAEKLAPIKESERRLKKLQELVTRSDGKPCLVPVTDPRPAIALTADFDDITEAECG